MTEINTIEDILKLNPQTATIEELREAYKLSYKIKYNNIITNDDENLSKDVLIYYTALNIYYSDKEKKYLDKVYDLYSSAVNNSDNNNFIELMNANLGIEIACDFIPVLENEQNFDKFYNLIINQILKNTKGISDDALKFFLSKTTEHLTKNSEQEDLNRLCELFEQFSLSLKTSSYHTDIFIDSINNCIDKLLETNKQNNKETIIKLISLMSKNIEDSYYSRLSQSISELLTKHKDKELDQGITKNLEFCQLILNHLKSKTQVDFQELLEIFKQKEQSLDEVNIELIDTLELNTLKKLMTSDSNNNLNNIYELYKHLLQNNRMIDKVDLNNKIYNYLSHIPLDTPESINTAKEIFNSIDLTIVGNELNNYIKLQHDILRKEQELYGINIQENYEDIENNIEEEIVNTVINQTFEEERQRAQDDLYTLDNIETNISADQTVESFMDDLKTEEGRKYLINNLFTKYFTDSSIGNLPEKEQREVEEFIKLSKEYFLDENNKNIHEQIVNLISYGSDVVGKYIENIMIDRMSNNLSNVGKIIDIINAGNDLNKMKEKSVSTMFKKLVVATLKRKEINEQEINKEDSEMKVMKEMKEITKNMQKQKRNMIKNKLIQHKIKKEKRMDSPITTNEILEQQFTDLSSVNNDLSETVVVQTANSFANDINNDYDTLIDEFNEETEREDEIDSGFVLN